MLQKKIMEPADRVLEEAAFIQFLKGGEFAMKLDRIFDLTSCEEVVSFIE